MTTPRKIRFFGLRKQFNIAVEAIQLLLFGELKLIDEVQTLQKRVAALEATQEMDAMMEMFDDGWDAAMESMDENEAVEVTVDNSASEAVTEAVTEAVKEIVNEIDASKRPEDHVV